MLLPINENVIAGECAQPLSVLKIFHSTRDPDRKIGATLTGFRVSFACEPIYKNSPLARNDTLMKMSLLR